MIGDTATGGTLADRAILVTGMLGAGPTAALKVLEDLGSEAVDSLPLRLMTTLVGQGSAAGCGLAVGIDIALATSTLTFLPIPSPNYAGKRRFLSTSYFLIATQIYCSAVTRNHAAFTLWPATGRWLIALSPSGFCWSRYAKPQT